MRSAQRPTPSALDQVVREARAELIPDETTIDWDRVERGLFARIEAERGIEQAHARFRGARWLWGTTATVAAAAAAAALVLGGGGSRAEEAFETMAPGSVTPDESAGELAALLDEGAVQVGRSFGIAPAAKGASLALGEIAETGAGRALFHAEGRATWLLEPSSRVRVSAVGPLVLNLEAGALEAEVVPVASGEAFAVDVDGVRIAVHGTHLRVARAGSAVSSDVSEEVVSIGVPPRVGSIYAALVLEPGKVTYP